MQRRAEQQSEGHKPQDDEDAATASSLIDTKATSKKQRLSKL